MNTVKINGKYYPMYGSGESMIIFMDELKSDLFETLGLFSMALAQGNIPNTVHTAKLMYAFIKGANPNAFASFEMFMKSCRSIKTFIEVDNITAVQSEINDLMDVGSLVEDNEEEPKKKVTENL